MLLHELKFTIFSKNFFNSVVQIRSHSHAVIRINVLPQKEFQPLKYNPDLDGEYFLWGRVVTTPFVVWLVVYVRVCIHTVR